MVPVPSAERQLDSIPSPILTLQPKLLAVPNPGPMRMNCCFQLPVIHLPSHRESSNQGELDWSCGPKTFA